MSDATTTAAVVVMGLPGSGKTGTCASLVTLARSLKGEIDADADAQVVSNIEVDIVSFDDVAASLGVKGVEGWHAAREEAYAQIAARLDAARTRCECSSANNEQSERRAIVLVDDTMVYRSMRKRVHALAVGAGAAYACVYVEIPIEEATARDASRPSPSRVGAATIAREAARLEQPDAASYAWEACSFRCDGMLPAAERASLMFQQLLHQLPWTPAVRVGRTVEEARALREAGSAANAASQAHAADIRTRAMLSRAMASVPRDVRAAHAAELSNLRRSLLDAARRAGGGTGHQVPPEEYELVMEDVFGAAEQRFADACDARLAVGQESVRLCKERRQ